MARSEFFYALQIKFNLIKEAVYEVSKESDENQRAKVYGVSGRVAKEHLQKQADKPRPQYSLEDGFE